MARRPGAGLMARSGPAVVAPPARLTVAERVERVAILDTPLPSAAQAGHQRAGVPGGAGGRPAQPPVEFAAAAWPGDLVAGRAPWEQETSPSQVDPGRKIRIRYRVVDLESRSRPTLDRRGNPIMTRRSSHVAGSVASQAQIDAIARKLDAGSSAQGRGELSDGPRLVGRPDGRER